MEETPFQAMGGLLLRVGVVQEGVDIEGMLLPPHVGQGRLHIILLRRTPHEETLVIIIKVVDVRAVIQAIHPWVVIGQVHACPCPLVVVVLPITIIQDAIGRHGQIQMTDPTGVGKVEVAKHRCTRLARLAIQTAPEADRGSRLQTRSFGLHMDQAVQGRGAIEHRGGPFQHLHLVDVLHRHHVPVDLARSRREDRHAIHHHQDTATHAIGPSRAATHRGLAVVQIDTRHVLQHIGQILGRLTGDLLRLQQIHGDGDVAQLLLIASDADHHLIHQVGLRTHRHIVRQELARGDRHPMPLRLITQIAEGDLRLAIGHLDLVVAVNIRHRTSCTSIILIIYIHTGQCLLGFRIGHMPFHILRPQHRGKQQETGDHKHTISHLSYSFGREYNPFSPS